MRKPLPMTKDGRIQWRRVAGFIEWAKAHLTTLTNREAIAEIEARWGVAVSVAVAESIRKNVGTRQTTETKARSLAARPRMPKKPPPPPRDPVEVMDEQFARRAEQTRSRNQTFFDLVGHKIIAAIKTMPPLPPVRPVTRRKSALHEEEAVLLLSDQQVGLVVDSRESGGLGRFDSDVLLEEIAYLQASIERIAEYHPNVKRLHVWFLGDTVEGETIYGGQLREIDKTVIQQTLYSVEHFTRMIRSLSEMFESVSCVGVVGNHGRIGRKGEHSPMSNFDYLCYKIIQERLAPVKRVKWTVPESWWTIERAAGWRFLLVHGDKTGQSSLGIPLYGAIRFRSRQREMHRTASMLTKALEEHGIEGVSEKDFDFVCMGHHSIAANLMGILMNGSWPGGTEFSIRELSMADIPSQKFFGVHAKHGVTWVRDVQLRPIRPPA